MLFASRNISRSNLLSKWRTVLGAMQDKSLFDGPWPAARSCCLLSTFAFNDTIAVGSFRLQAAGTSQDASSSCADVRRADTARAPAPAAASTQRLAARPVGTHATLRDSMSQAQASGQHSSVLSLFAASQLGAGIPDQYLKQLFELALDSCAATGNAAQALHLISVMWKRRVYVGPAAHLSAVQALCKAGRLGDALNYLLSIPAKDKKGRKRLRVFMCNTVLLAAVKKGDLQVARRVEALMSERSVRPDHMSYGSLMELRGLEGDAPAVHAVWEQAAAAGACTSDHPQLYAARVIGLARAGELDAAVAAVEAMMDAYAQLLPVQISTPPVLPFSSPSPLQHLFHHHHNQQPPQEARRWRQEGDPASPSSSPDAGSSPEPDDGAIAGRVSQWGGAAGAAGSGGRPGSGAAQQGLSAPLVQLRAACNAVLRKAEAVDDQGAVKRLTSLMTLRGLPPSTTTFNVLLRATVARSHDAAAAVQAVQDGMREMEALGAPPNQETLELLLEAQGRAGDLGGVQAALEAIDEAGWEPTLGAWSGVMRFYGAAADLEGVSNTYEQLVDRGVPLTAGIFRASFDAIKAWGEGQASQRALQDAHSATFTNERIHSKQLVGALLHRWAADMEAHVIHHTPASFTALLHALGYGGQPDTVVHLMHLAFDHPPHTTTSTSSSSSSSNGSSSSRGAGSGASSSVLVDVSGGGEPAMEASSGGSEGRHSTTFNGSSSSSSRGGGGGEGGLFVSGEGRETCLGGEGGVPHGGSAVGVATSTAAAAVAVPPLHGGGDDEGGEASSWVFEGAVVRAGLQPDPRIFSAAIGACARLGKLEEAMELLRLMRALGLEPSVHTYTSLIACCAYMHMAQLARGVFNDMREAGVAPTLFTYNALLKVECHCGSLDSALRLLSEMEWQGHPPDAVSWRTLLSAARYLGRSDVAELALRQLEGGPQEEEGAGLEEGEDLGDPAVQHAQQHGDEGWHGYYATDEDEDEED